MESPDEKKELIRAKALELGFEECGFAQADRVCDEAIAQYERWLKDGKNDCMDYAGKYRELRNDPRELFPGAKTVISVALNYYPEHFQHKDAPKFSYYAYGRDYHDVIRERLNALAEYILEKWDEKSRVCVDTAPIMEKYWARMAGLGMIGRNNLLIIPGKGSFFFLGELITTLDIEPDVPCTESCGNCMLCVKSCPGGALTDNSSLDARRCLSCQLIERRGELPSWIAETTQNHVYGCDECQLSCPHNKNVSATIIEDFKPKEEFLELTFERISTMDNSEFKRIFGKSAVRRVKLEGLLRNAKIIKR